MNAKSVKDRLKNQAIQDGKTMQDKLVTYGLERTRIPIVKAIQNDEAFEKTWNAKSGEWIYRAS